MQFAGLSKNPANDIEQSKWGVKNKKENIKELVPHLLRKEKADKKCSQNVIAQLINFFPDYDN